MRAMCIPCAFDRQERFLKRESMSGLLGSDEVGR